MAYVQSNSFDAGGSTSVSLSLPSNTAGNFLVFAVMTADAAKASISDTAGNIWQTGFIQNPNISWGIRLFYAENCKASAGTNTVTVTSNAAQNMRTVFAEYSGMATALSYSAAAHSPSTLSTGSFGVTSGDLVIAVGFSLGGVTAAGTGLTSRRIIDGMMLADGIASGSTFTASMTGTSTASIFAVAFHVSPAPDEGLYKGGDYSMSDGATGSYSEAATFVSNTAGNALVAFVLLAVTPTTLTLSDTAGNTWSLITSLGGGFFVYCVASCAASSGKNVVTATALLPSGSRLRLWIAEYQALTVTANATASAASVSISSAIGSLVVAGYQGTASAVTGGTGFSARKTSGDMLIEDGIATANPTTASVGGGGSSPSLIAIALGAFTLIAQPQIFVVT